MRSISSHDPEAATVFESLFALLFKYHTPLFTEGALALSPSRGAQLAAVAVAAGGLWALVSFWRAAPARVPLSTRAGLLAIRGSMLLVLLACLLRPVLVVRAAVPQQNFVGVLVDDSRSLQVADVGEGTRAAFVRDQVVSEESALMHALTQRFAVRMFRFSTSAERLQPGAELKFDGTATRIDRALTRARDELQGLPVAGLVVVSDGADSSEGALDEALLAVKAAGIPIFTVGVGSETLDRDIQVGRVSAPRVVLNGTTLVTDVILTQRGFTDQAVVVNVEDGGRILGSETVTLARDGEPTTVRVRYTLNDPGFRHLRVRVPPQPGELIQENNARDLFIEVDDRKDKVLYVEGEPRWEVKFIRRALATDKNVQLVVLQRTAENKFLRLGVADGEELASGFPRTREELFAYRGLILGSLEASALTGDQLRMIADFVDRRGGGLIALGGRRAFAEGGYAGTPLADVLPVVLEGKALDGADPPLARLAVSPTRAGLVHPVTQLAPRERDSAARWKDLPPLTSVNRVERVKPGATVLLTGRGDDRGERVVLAHQRYGRGSAVAFTVQDSWEWQMNAQMAVDDQTHETLWRQLVRWTIDGVPNQVDVTTSRDRVEPGDPVEVVASVSDGAYIPLNTAQVTATVTKPDGAAVDVPLTWSGRRDGEYRASVSTDALGEYDVHVEAALNGQLLGVDSTALQAAPGDTEFVDPAMHRATLEHLAAETGGRSYGDSELARLADDIKYTGRGITTTEERDLWDMPAVLLLVLGLMFGEWTWRRLQGLA